MECFTGLSAAAGVGAKAVFDYNRENFLYDRNLRLRKEFQVQKFRITQAELWREDVRDLISLTEYKMHVYLLVNVLLLGFTVVLWCEGRLPLVTPDWLMMGHALSTAGSSMFLLLSIWLAMHAAVAAQSFETRLLTQMVRLPIPTWQEVEACRTYGSEFEKVEPGQMFRVPWVMGRQEDLVKPAQRQARPGDAEGGAPSLSPEAVASNAGSNLGSNVGSTGVNGTTSDDVLAASNADPWGLERRGDGIEELGCKQYSEVAGLRHVQLSRQAMIHFQAYDAFARIAMNIGVSQLLLAISYYLLGYVSVEVGCRTAATWGVLILTVMSEMILRLDMSLLRWQLRVLQLALATGPLMMCLAAYLWAFQKETLVRRAHGVSTVAFLAHFSHLMLVEHFCRIRRHSNGAMLPAAFRSVLYLDVFGWLKTAQHIRDDTQSIRSGPVSPSSLVSKLPARLTQSEGAQSKAPGTPRRHKGGHSGHAALRPHREGDPGAPTPSERVVHVGKRPALEAVSYSDGAPVPRRPEDMRPPDAVEDFRHLPGAPRLAWSGQPHESADTEFFDAALWLPEKTRPNTDMVSAGSAIVTGHEREAARIMPWKVFTSFMRCLAAAWLMAAVWHAYLALKPGFDAMSWEEGPTTADAIIVDTMPAGQHPGLSLMGIRSDISNGFSSGFSTLSMVFRTTTEVVTPTWPYEQVEPRSLACDAAGRHFVVTDGLSLFSATLLGGTAGTAPAAASNAQQPTEVSMLQSRAGRRRPAPLALRRSGMPVKEDASASSGPLAMTFQEVPCLGLLGEGLQDAAVSCSGAGDCESLVLHRHGRRAAACRIPGDSPTAFAGPVFAANISSAWLEQLRLSDEAIEDAGTAEGIGAPHSRIEKAVAMLVDMDCTPAAGGLGAPVGGWGACAVVGTNRGRVVRLQQHEPHAELSPEEVLVEGKLPVEEHWGAGAVRLLGQRFVGVLSPGGGSLLVFDARDGASVGRLKIPIHAAAFCAGGGHTYLLASGPSPAIWRMPLPAELLAA